jgi:hypothetical protein
VACHRIREVNESGRNIRRTGPFIELKWSFVNRAIDMNVRQPAWEIESPPETTGAVHRRATNSEPELISGIRTGRVSERLKRAKFESRSSGATSRSSISWSQSQMYSAQVKQKK